MCVYVCVYCLYLCMCIWRMYVFVCKGVCFREGNGRFFSWKFIYEIFSEIYFEIFNEEILLGF